MQDEPGERTNQDEDREKELHELHTQIKFLEDEVALLRRRLQSSPRQVKVLEERLLEAKSEVARALAQNEKLAGALKSEREKIEALREEVEKLTQPPASFGVYLGTNDDDTVDIFTSGRKMRVNVAPEVDRGHLVRGAEVILNEGLNVIEVLPQDRIGEVVTVKEILADDRVIVLGRGDEEVVAIVSKALQGDPFRVGDALLYDPRSGHVLERLPKEEIEELVLEEIPDVSYTDIGGLATQIEDIRDAVEMPFLYAELFREHQLRPPKGVLLYGPPGCGKTLIAKAVANSLAQQVAQKTGREGIHSYFLNVKGPELLNKYVGETERQIRIIFQRAKEKAQEGFPVIVFFDEMDSIFRIRGSGISSDVENTIVPQLLSEIDGVETLKNVIVIGASNREDLIDPALLRPGRLDVKIKIERPDASSAKDIMSKYMNPEIPIHPDDVKSAGGDVGGSVKRMINRTVEQMYSTDDANRFLEVTYQNGDKEVLYFKDFNSGAMIENIVQRAKKMAIKRFLQIGEKGVKMEDLLHAVRAEFKENEDLPNTTNPDDWARISGKKGERIIFVRTLLGDGQGESGRQVEQVRSGQYL
ncbi:MAG TPA: proteasome ATPase [Actinomycetota bacterium]|jgi:proteasome-associated ATPase|nr:proteasome ATPase [Actinomycetota bacterium]